jgi:hypothetical protein
MSLGVINFGGKILLQAEVNHYRIAAILSTFVRCYYKRLQHNLQIAVFSEIGMPKLFADYEECN